MTAYCGLNGLFYLLFDYDRAHRAQSIGFLFCPKPSVIHAIEASFLFQFFICMIFMFLGRRFGSDKIKGEVKQ